MNTMNTDTPETESTMPERDNLWAKHDGLTPRCCADMIALAGKLEIERNQARKERDELMQMLLEAQLQLEYLDEKQGSGTTVSMISKIESLLQKLKEPKSEGVL